MPRDAGRALHHSVKSCAVSWLDMLWPSTKDTNVLAIFSRIDINPSFAKKILTSFNWSATSISTLYVQNWYRISKSWTNTSGQVTVPSLVDVKIHWSPKSVIRSQKSANRPPPLPARRAWSVLILAFLSESEQTNKHPPLRPLFTPWNWRSHERSGFNWGVKNSPIWGLLIIILMECWGPTPHRLNADNLTNLPTSPIKKTNWRKSTFMGFTKTS